MSTRKSLGNILSRFSGSHSSESSYFSAHDVFGPVINTSSASQQYVSPLSRMSALFSASTSKIPHASTPQEQAPVYLASNDSASRRSQLSVNTLDECSAHPDLDDDPFAAKPISRPSTPPGLDPRPTSTVAARSSRIRPGLVETSPVRKSKISPCRRFPPSSYRDPLKAIFSTSAQRDEQRPLPWVPSSLPAHNPHKTYLREQPRRRSCSESESISSNSAHLHRPQPSGSFDALWRAADDVQGYAGDAESCAGTIGHPSESEPVVLDTQPRCLTTWQDSYWFDHVKAASTPSTPPEQLIAAAKDKKVHCEHERHALLRQIELHESHLNRNSRRRKHQETILTEDKLQQICAELIRMRAEHDANEVRKRERCQTFTQDYSPTGRPRRPDRVVSFYSIPQPSHPARRYNVISDLLRRCVDAFKN